MRASSARIASRASPDAIGVDPSGDLQRARIGVVDEPGRDVIREPALLADGQEEAAAHPVAEHGIEDGQRPAVRVVAMESRQPQADLGLRRAALADRDRGRRRAGAALARTRAACRCPSRRPRRPGRRLPRGPDRRRRRRRCWPAGRPTARTTGSSSREAPGCPPRRRRSRGRAGRRRTVPIWNRIWQYSDGIVEVGADLLDDDRRARSRSPRSASVGRTISSPSTSTARAASRRGTRTQ